MNLSTETQLEAAREIIPLALTVAGFPKHQIDTLLGAGQEQRDKLATKFAAEFGEPDASPEFLMLLDALHGATVVSLTQAGLLRPNAEDGAS